MPEVPNTPRTTTEHSRRRAKPAEILLRCAISLGMIAAAVAVFFLSGRKGLSKREELPEPPKPVVECVTAVAHQGGIDFDVDGVVIPFRSVQVPAEVAGSIQKKSENCRVGHLVKRGEWLMQIDPRDYDLEIRRLQEDLRQAEVNLRELDLDTKARGRQINLAEEDLAIQQREVQRYEDIRNPGVYTQSELDAVRLKVVQARDVLYTDQDQLELLQTRRDRIVATCEFAQAQLEKAQLDLTRTEIQSPITGVITAEPVEQGSYVQRGSTVAAIQDTSRMEIRCSLHMYQMQWLWQTAQPAGPSQDARNSYRLPATPVTIQLDTGTTRFSWEGIVAYFDGAQIDQQTRMIPCRVQVNDPSDVRVEGQAENALVNAPMTLMAGMFVTVRIHASPGFGLLRLPEDAIQPGNVVWTVRQSEQSQDGIPRLHRSPLQVAHASDGNVLVFANGSDLTAGDRVVVSPLASPTENTPVEILEAK